MLIASCCVGDLLVTLVVVQPLSRDDDETYNLTFTDNSTGETYTHVIRGENKALLMFAAWIAADEASIGDLEPLRKELQDSPLHTFGMP